MQFIDHAILRGVSIPLEGPVNAGRARSVVVSYDDTPNLAVSSFAALSALVSETALGSAFLTQVTPLSGDLLDRQEPHNFASDDAAPGREAGCDASPCGWQLPTIQT